MEAQPRQIRFNLVVDGFRIKYIGEDNIQQLYDALRKEIYGILEDRAGDYTVEST
jgi:hypothetical protein